MPSIRANGIDLEYEIHGPANGAPMLLIMGLGAQLTMWPLPFVEALARRGYRVIRFDNRDCGLSTKCDAAGTPNLYTLVLARIFGMRPRVPYTLADMALDATGLLDALGIDRAHVVGASMGGMIAQHLAARHPDRVLSLASIMSTTGNPALPRPSREALRVLLTRPRSNDIEAVVAHGIRAAKAVGSPRYPVDDAALASRVRALVSRMHHPPGISRQLAAIIADGDRRAMLKTITAPTVVIHGVADPLVPVAGGRDTAANIPGARLIEIDGMGHNMPLPLVPDIANAVDQIAAERAAA
jgi:pimeloyl-ACP methyl ester carboxylesterase